MFRIILASQPQKFLKNLDKSLRKRIWDKLDELRLNPFPNNVKRLMGKRNKAFRVRVGNYRIQYEVNQRNSEILIFNLDKRAKAYN